MLAPPSSHAFLSYVTGESTSERSCLSQIFTYVFLQIGWTTLLGWQATVASSAYLGATLIQGLVVLNNPAYTIELWHGTLIIWAIVLLAVFFNTIIVRLLPQIEGLILILHVLGLFAILIPLVYMAPHDKAEHVFTTFLNEGMWPSEGIAFFLGLLFMVFSFLGMLKCLSQSYGETSQLNDSPGTDGVVHVCSTNFHFWIHHCLTEVQDV